MLWYIEPFSKLYNWDDKKFNFKLGNSEDIQKFNQNYKNQLIQTYPHFDEYLFNNLLSYFNSLEDWKNKTTENNVDYFFSDNNFHLREVRYSKKYTDFMKDHNEELKTLYKDMKVKKYLFYESVYHYIKKYSKIEEVKGQFVFPFLKKKNYDTTSDEFYNKISSSTTYINKNLKVIGKIVDINKKITNHISRHSMTSISKSLGVDIYDLKNMLGHTSVKQTETYINSLSTNTSVQNTININNILDN